MKRTAGLIAAAVGISGTVLSIVLVVQLWSLARRLDREAPRFLQRLEQAAGSIRHQADATGTLLQTARQRVRMIADTVEELSAAAAEEVPTTTTVLETLDETFVLRLQAAEEFVVSMQSSVQNLGSSLLLFNSLPFLGPRVAPVEGAGQSRLESLAEGLSETTELLTQVRATIARARSGQPITPRQIAQVRTAIERIDRTLGDVQTDAAELAQIFGDAGENFAALRLATPRRLRRAALVATVFLVCFACSQISLLLHGWSLVTARSPAQTSPPHTR